MSAATPVPGARVRALAAASVDQVLRQGRSLKAVLADALGRLADPRDRALLESMCFGALRWRGPYEHALSHWLQRPLGARDAQVHALLLVGLAQLDAMKLPAHAALASTAEAARELKRPALVGLVNAILRRATREPLPVPENEAVRQSHPEWLARQLREDWPDRAGEIMSANNAAAPMWLRVNRRRADPDQYLERLREAGIGAVRSSHHPAAIVLDESLPPTRLPGWENGDVSIQDGAAQLAAEALAPAPGDRVLDACAAPGGKTAHLMELHPEIRITALDVDARRLARVTTALSRLGIHEGVEYTVADAGLPDTWWDGEPFDSVLLDAPCSATGIIRRQPDIKWHRREEDVSALVAQQARLLDALWQVLRPGGILVYATCSVLKAENASQIDAFVRRTPDAVVELLDERFGAPSGPGRQRMPGEDGMDGFFYARLRRGETGV